MAKKRRRRPEGNMQYHVYFSVNGVIIQAQTHARVKHLIKQGFRPISKRKRYKE